MKKKETIITLDKLEEKGLIEFLSRAKDGKYALIDKASLPYTRKSENIETIDSSQEENYYYNLA